MDRAERKRRKRSWGIAALGVCLLWAAAWFWMGTAGLSLRSVPFVVWVWLGAGVGAMFLIRLDFLLREPEQGDGPAWRSALAGMVRQLCVGGAVASCLTALAVSILFYCPEQTIERDGIRLVARTQGLWGTKVDYYRYEGPLFYGQKVEFVEDPEETGDEETTAAQENLPRMDTSAIRGEHGELTFAATMEDYVEGYNAVCEGEDLLRALPEWSRLEYDRSPYSEYPSVYYEFKYNMEIHTEPAISAYVCAQSGQIQEICLSFPEHGWTDYGYDLFAEECQYTFRLFFPELTQQERGALFDALFADAYREECYVDVDEERSPTIIRWRGDVGVYPFLHCGMIKFCVIPVDRQYLDGFAENGGAVYELEDERLGQMGCGGSAPDRGGGDSAAPRQWGESPGADG